MTISTGNSYLDALGTNASSTAKSNSKNTIDQAGFLKLLTTQLKTQDPTAPVDNSQMAAQMAQFSTVAGISEMNASIKAMATDVTTSRFGAASSLVGRTALIQSDTAAALSNGAYAGQITLPSDATSLSMSLVDASGSTVFAHDFGAKTAGDTAWSWDGKNAAGEAVPGPLKMVVAAIGKTGAVTATKASWAEIQSVQSPASGTTKLNTALGTFTPAQVQQLG